MWKRYYKIDGKVHRLSYEIPDYKLNSNLTNICPCLYINCEGIIVDKSKKIQICSCGRTKLEYLEGDK